MIVTLAGVVVGIIGVVLGVWTAAALGWRRLMWLSDESRMASVPQLVFAGPYRLTRHPFFLAVLVTMAGAAAASGSRSIGVMCALAVVMLPALAWGEERLLIRRFGEAYQRYQQSVPFILPWWPKRK